MENRTIVIHQSGPNYFSVSEGDRHISGVSWDECLGQVAALIIANQGDDIRGFRMKTLEDAREEGKREGLREAERDLRPCDRTLKDVERWVA